MNRNLPTSTEVSPPPANFYETPAAIALIERALHLHADAVRAKRERAQIVAELLQLREEDQEAA